MDLYLKDKISLITGSSRGLGLSIAKVLHLEGCHVIINGRDEGLLKERVAEFGYKASYLLGDVTDISDCRKIFDLIDKDYSHLDILVCNVGSGSSVLPGNETLEEWKRVLDLNFLSATNTVQTLRPLLARSKNASITCISSICGQEILGAPLTYSSAKAALNTYVRGIARPLAKENIRINAVAPGNLIFEGSVWERKVKENEQAVQSMLDQEVAQSRLGKPEEIASFVAFLSSARASFATGETYVVDGGQVRS